MDLMDQITHTFILYKITGFSDLKVVWKYGIMESQVSKTFNIDLVFQTFLP